MKNIKNNLLLIDYLIKTLRKSNQDNFTDELGNKIARLNDDQTDIDFCKAQGIPLDKDVTTYWCKLANCEDSYITITYMNALDQYGLTEYNDGELVEMINTMPYTLINAQASSIMSVTMMKAYGFLIDHSK